MRYRKDNPDDETAVRQVLAGKREMFVPLLRRHYASTLRLSQRILDSETEAEDVAQEAALQAFLNLRRLREPRQFAAWLHSIAANLARSTQRRRRPLPLEPLVEGAWSIDASPTPEEVRSTRELHDTILQALDHLSNVNRDAVIGYYLEGQSYAELAELLGVPLSTIKGRLYKGRRELEPALAPVAREVLGIDRKREEVDMDGKETIEVMVDDVIQVSSGDEGWREFSEVAKSMGEAYDPARHGTPATPAVLLLREVDGERVLPIYVGMGEAFSIWLSITGGQSMRPLTHDLMRQILETVDLRVRNATVSRLAEHTFYAEISLNQGGISYQVDARPSDAIALAVHLKAPIYTALPVFEEAALSSKQAWPEWHRDQFGTDERK